MVLLLVYQKGPPEVFYKKKLFLKLSQYSQEKPVLESLFSFEYSEIFKNIYFGKHLRTAASFFLSRFSFTNIHDSRDSRGKGRQFLLLLSTTSTRFTDT